MRHLDAWGYFWQVLTNSVWLVKAWSSNLFIKNQSKEFSHVAREFELQDEGLRETESVGRWLRVVQVKSACPWSTRFRQAHQPLLQERGCSGVWWTLGPKVVASHWVPRITSSRSALPTLATGECEPRSGQMVFAPTAKDREPSPQSGAAGRWACWVPAPRRAT